MSAELQQRIERVERENRWWKRLALGCMAFSALLLLSGVIASFRVQARIMSERLRVERAVNEVELARHEGEKAQLRAQQERDIALEQLMRAEAERESAEAHRAELIRKKAKR